MFYILGIAICLAAILQMGMWITVTLQQSSENRKNFETLRQQVQQQINDAVEDRKNQSAVESTGVWNGYREFFVSRLTKEVEAVTSVYLKPVDGKPIVEFKPGQHLTFKFNIPGESKPQVRCYSLSSAAKADHYRISVKAMPANGSENPPGRVSNFVNKILMEGDRVEVKAPGGAFYLDETGSSPIILLAGGIGITPMISMIDHLVSRDSQRLIVLFYGVRNGRDHAFKDYLSRIANKYSNVHVVSCYSAPEPNEREGTDFHTAGFVSIDLIKQLLPSNQCRFYLCGPPPFMKSLYEGLTGWEVPENRINFEAFGPASLKKKSKAEESSSESNTTSSQVTFAESEKQLSWNSDFDSILEMAEANDVPMDSGCRAGSCGTCQTKLLNGKVKYVDGVQPDCETGQCLPCVAQPDGDIELDI